MFFNLKKNSIEKKSLKNKQSVFINGGLDGKHKIRKSNNITQNYWCSINHSGEILLYAFSYSFITVESSLNTYLQQIEAINILSMYIDYSTEIVKNIWLFASIDGKSFHA